MSGLTPVEITKLVERYIGTDGGYLKKFSYSSHESFYSIYCDLDIDVAAQRERFGTTKYTYIGILKEASPTDQARILRGTFAYIASPDAPEDDPDPKRLAVYLQLMEVVKRLESTGTVQVSASFETRETVFQALKDAEILLNQRGPEFAVDRAHTALHGFLKTLCDGRGLQVSSTASITDIFGIMRREFPELKAVVAHDGEAKKLIGSLATALDTLNTIRNRGTLAHPNEMLLDGPEAMLFINISRSILGYLESKLGATTKSGLCAP